MGQGFVVLLYFFFVYFKTAMTSTCLLFSSSGSATDEVMGIVITSETRLHNQLFPNGTKKVTFPTTTKPIMVTIGITLSQVVDIEEINEAVVINAWIRQGWSNRDISWNSIDFENITHINVKPNMVWAPDIYSYANIDDDKSYNGLLNTVSTAIQIFNDGSHKWNAPIILRLGCTINVQDFPFDTQECHLRFGSFMYGERIELFGESESAELSMYTENAEWNFISMKCTHDVMTYNRHNGGKSHEVTYHLIMKRKPLFLLINLLLPNIILSVLTVAVYVLPVTSGERASFVVSLLLAMALFLTSAFNLMPDSSEAIPFFTYFLGTTLLAMSLLLTSLCYTYSIYYANATVMKLPSWMRKYILRMLAPIMGVQNYKQCHWWRKISTFKQHNNFKRIITLKLPHGHPGSLWSTTEKKMTSSEEELVKQRLSLQRNLREVTNILDKILCVIEDQQTSQYCEMEWQVVAVTLDKLALYIFSIVYATILLSFGLRAWKM